MIDTALETYETRKGRIAYVFPVPYSREVMDLAKGQGGWFTFSAPRGAAFWEEDKAQAFGASLTHEQLNPPKKASGRKRKAASRNLPKQAPKARAKLNMAQLERSIASMEKKAADCFADRPTNTPKRLAQAMTKRLDGERLERQTKMLQAIVDAGKAPQDLASYTARDLIALAKEASRRCTTDTPNGYHSYYVETDEWGKTNPEHNTLRALLTRDPACELERQRVEDEAQLRNSSIPGFFPTPQKVIDVMIEQCGPLQGLRVLEPTAGKGDIVQAALDAGAASVVAFEIIPRLHSFIADHVKPSPGQTLAHQRCDFLNQSPVLAGSVHRVIMNPPFENGQAPLMVRHAVDWLDNGGRCVSIMPSNWANHKHGKALEAYLETCGASWYEMEIKSGAFAGADSFCQTGVSTTLLIIDI